MSTPNPVSDSRRVGTLDFQVTALSVAVERTLDEALQRQSEHLHFANAWSVALADGDFELQEAFQTGRNYPDGKPVVWAMAAHGRKGMTRPARVDGPTFFENALETGVSRGIRHYLLGSTPETLAKLQENVRRRFPGVEIVGASSPPFKNLTPEDYAHELAMIEASMPHIVWVGLGTPKQDKAAAYLSSRYPGIFACVGAAFDYTAGNLRVAPYWMQETGLGWLYRFVHEPRRLWRRYIFGNAKFIRIVSKQLVRERFGIDPAG